MRLQPCLLPPNVLMIVGNAFAPSQVSCQSWSPTTLNIFTVIENVKHLYNTFVPRHITHHSCLKTTTLNIHGVGDDAKHLRRCCRMTDYFVRPSKSHIPPVVTEGDTSSIPQRLAIKVNDMCIRLMHATCSELSVTALEIFIVGNDVKHPYLSEAM